MVTVCIFYAHLQYLQQFGVFNVPLDIFWSFGIFSGHLVYFLVIWYIFWSFGIFFPLWYDVPRKIRQPLSTASVAQGCHLESAAECDPVTGPDLPLL
jgi:hypothetical protein